MVAFPDADLGWLQPSDPSTSLSAEEDEHDALWFWLEKGKPCESSFTTKVENVKALLEVETWVLLQQQQLLYNGMEMRNSEMLGAPGVNDEDLIMIVSNVASRIYGCNAFDAYNKEEGTTLMELLWHVEDFEGEADHLKL
ncbi:hypothetical protein DVH24_002024 [Malus domestica]|uniref:Ubiquitin-like domain-containing protein n=1 Tax=Malus domestica TaxID=3750 RepID=A0A498I4S8_MALDO|nr:hypothetical protein DVH24_002024 [Malus domestica]